MVNNSNNSSSNKIYHIKYEQLSVGFNSSLSVLTQNGHLSQSQVYNFFCSLFTTASRSSVPLSVCRIFTFQLCINTIHSTLDMFTEESIYERRDHLLLDTSLAAREKCPRLVAIEIRSHFHRGKNVNSHILFICLWRWSFFLSFCCCCSRLSLTYLTLRFGLIGVVSIFWNLL